MTLLTFQALQDKLPAGSIEFVGNNQVKINMNMVTGNNLTLESSIIEGIVKLLNGLSMLTDAINAQLIASNSPPIQFASQELVGTPAQPEYRFEVKADVDTSLFLVNIKDPTE
ncbi:MAG: hypothetical protein ACFKPT_13870 [Gloeotrichia echinulata GP01]